MPGGSRLIRLLSLSTVFPNPADTGLGLFVRSRLEHMAAAGAGIRVIAPVPLIDYSAPGKRWWKAVRIPRTRRDGRLEVAHPRWLFPPLGTVVNVCCLFGRLFYPVFKLKREFGFDIIDAHFGYPEGVAAWLLASAAGKPFTVTLRGNEPMHGSRRLRRALMARAFRRAGRVITVSESLRQYAISLGAAAKLVKTIPNGVDAQRFYPRDRAAARRKYGLAADARVVLSVGGLIERKGHHRVIRALKTLAGRGIDALLLVAGSAGREGYYEQEIRRTIAETGMQDAVRLLGQMDSEAVAELMSACDVFCLASTREGWPNVVHEAMACGAPVIATSVGGVADMVPSDKYGIVVPVNDPEALEAALGQALEKQWDRAAISEWARSRSWERVAAEVLEQMREIATAARGAA